MVGSETCSVGGTQRCRLSACRLAHCALRSTLWFLDLVDVQPRPTLPNNAAVFVLLIGDAATAIVRTEFDCAAGIERASPVASDYVECVPVHIRVTFERARAS